MALYIPHSIFYLARLLYVRPETFGPYCVHTATSKNYFTHQHLKNCLYYIHVFYVFDLSNNFMYFTCLIIYHNRRHTSNFSQEQMRSLMMTH